MHKHFYNYNTELTYSIFYSLIGKPKWFCRIWTGIASREGYGGTKFEAYRNAKKSKIF